MRQLSTIAFCWLAIVASACGKLESSLSEDKASCPEKPTCCCGPIIQYSKGTNECHNFEEWEKRGKEPTKETASICNQAWIN